ncbi:NADH:flavin oxidoreductase/NADH oxidase [Mycolicibacterium rufum]|uniref:NADH:flavin oxidoreductase/NADH oxidase n=1 Tax=Mycolicibacterium rufum TaxID=318424 RepID=A0A9X3BJJ8_9MYCO|nr:NADH:flavin oxidoreductase/NADH oxidase [Mycolicibacterium rufum]KGI67314.1 oxidoreductase [Mycolicibacterium rufum]MCV7073448.1 NADH:flavin oxidoreductase/NADH oxidase [Mycolicibacterium rufum]ULP38241.1 NADH:flavin oxidoreductase/NADH oxidase [Mycolicibacterium rufum]
MTTHLFDPLTLRGVTFAHRVWMSPMMQFAAVPDGPDTGTPTDWHVAHLGARAVGGAALVMTEATAILPQGRSSDYDLGLWNDTQARALQRITTFLTGLGAVPGIQLVHAGRKGSTGRPWPDPDRTQNSWPTTGPSAVSFGRLPAPDELTVDEIAHITKAFGAAAARAAHAGFRVLELHGAHGYLIHQFLSPQSNHRTDRYGGSLTNRMRFAIEVVDEVRRHWPDELPLFFRTSATDWLAGDTDDERPGWTVADAVELAAVLEEHGVDLADVSSGGIVHDAPITVGPGYQVPFAQAVRDKAGIPTAAVGLITDAHQAETIVSDGQADAVFLARELLRNPMWPRQAAAALGHMLAPPPQYTRAFT